MIQFLHGVVLKYSFKIDFKVGIVSTSCICWHWGIAEYGKDRKSNNIIHRNIIII